MSCHVEKTANKQSRVAESLPGVAVEAGKEGVGNKENASELWGVCVICARLGEYCEGIKR